MIKSKTFLEMKIGEHNFEFVCSPESSYGQVYDALCHMKSFIVNKINEIEQNEKPKDQEPQ
jgi:hypothetical protein